MPRDGSLVHRMCCRFDSLSRVDLAHVDARFRNDATGATAYPPAMLLKVVLFAYSQGIVRSRAIERVCQEHVTFVALRGLMASHFTTISHSSARGAMTSRRSLRRY